MFSLVSVSSLFPSSVGSSSTSTGAKELMSFTLIGATASSDFSFGSSLSSSFGSSFLELTTGTLSSSVAVLFYSIELRSDLSSNSPLMLLKLSNKSSK